MEKELSQTAHKAETGHTALGLQVFEKVVDLTVDSSWLLAPRCAFCLSNNQRVSMSLQVNSTSCFEREGAVSGNFGRHVDEESVIASHRFGLLSASSETRSC